MFQYSVDAPLQSTPPLDRTCGAAVQLAAGVCTKFPVKYDGLNQQTGFLVGVFKSLSTVSVCLWNSTCKEYSNEHLQNLRQNANCSFLQRAGKFVVKKIHAFLRSFRREFEKALKWHKSDACADDVCVPTVWYYDLLGFIPGSEVPRRGESNVHLLDVADDGDKSEMDCTSVSA